MLCALVGFILGRLTARARDSNESADALETESVADVIAARVAAPRDLTGEAETSRGVVGAIARAVGFGNGDADARARQLGAELALKTEAYVRNIEVESSVLSSELEATTRGTFDDASYDSFMSTLRASAFDDSLADASMDYADFSLASMEKYGVDVSMTLSEDGDAFVAT